MNDGSVYQRVHNPYCFFAQQFQKPNPELWINDYRYAMFLCFHVNDQ